MWCRWAETTSSLWSGMKEEICFPQMCCENSPCEVEGTLENEEHMMEPDAEGRACVTVDGRIKRMLPGQSDALGPV